jgi:hypothetical protein
MARAAVRAKQLEKAKAQPARTSRSHGRRRHSGGGDPNQELFFVRLRRHQKWVYAVLAVVFGLSFVLVGVGSGVGAGGLSSLWTGIFGGNGSSSVSKAQALVRTNPAKGYRALATAYESTPGDNVLAISALQNYLALKKSDAAAWAELGGLELTQGSQYATQYQQAQQATQLADPSAPFLPNGTLGTAIGSNAAYQQASQQASSTAAQAYQQATTALSSAVSDYQKAAQIHPRSTTYLQELLSAAFNAGNTTVATATLRKLLAVDPHAPLAPQWRRELRQLTKSTQKAKSGSG